MRQCRRTLSGARKWSCNGTGVTFGVRTALMAEWYAIRTGFAFSGFAIGLQSDGSFHMTTRFQATFGDLARTAGKAELINGEVVPMPPTGDAPGTAGDEIYYSLRKHVDRVGTGHAVGDNKAFRVNLPHRESLSPDAAFYTGPRTGMKFYTAAPAFAAEVRSEGDYGPQAEEAMAAKRADYFAAGTLVVWDVDLLNEAVVRKYEAADPARPKVFRRGQVADAEPAVAGWRMAVDELFQAR